MNKAIFIDRDGTLLEEVGYLKMLEDLRFTFRATEALRLFHEAGYLNIVITNQSAVARGLLSPKELKKIHTKLKSLAAEDQAKIDDIVFCPHFPDGRVAPYNVECDCRKPKTGMILQSAEKHRLNLNESIVVGDKVSDLQMAKNAGIKGVLVLTGYGAQTRNEWQDPVEIFPNLYELAKTLKHE